MRTLVEPVEGCVSVILACGTAAPLVSVIVPWIVPVAFVTWEKINGVCVAAAKTAKTSARALVTSPDSGKNLRFSLIMQKLYAIGRPYGQAGMHSDLNCCFNCGYILQIFNPGTKGSTSGVGIYVKG